MMKQSEMSNMRASLNAQINVIREYVTHQEDLLTAYSKAPVVADFLKNPDDEQKRILAQQYTENYYAGLDNWEGLYIGEWNTHIIAHSNPGVVGITTREGEALKALQDAMISRNGLYNAGIIVSPASQKLVLSLYCPVFDQDGTTIIGYVGGGPFADGLKSLLDSTENQTSKYSMINVESGMYIFDQDETLMATEIQDELLLSVISTIQQDQTKLTGDKEYIDAEVGQSIASYQYISEYGWAVVSRDSEANIYAVAYKNMNVLRMLCIVSVLVIGFLSWVFIRLSTKPLKYVETAIIQLKELKLQKEHKLDKYINCKSEIGQIATAIDSLYESFKDIVSTLEHCSDSLTNSAANMSDSSKTLLRCVEENSYTTEQFAQHTESITDTVRRVDHQIGEIAEVVSQVESKIQDGTDRSDDLLDKVSQMKTTVSTSLHKTSLRIKENQKAIEDAMLNLQLLTRIDEMATQILEITDQTNLLSLNASIEAARAGEAGKGFAVVSGEIGKLAASSSSTATEIQNICNETKLSISEVQACFDNIISFMQNDVQKQFEDFVKETNEYNHLIEEIQNIIADIDQSANVFVEAVSNIRNQIDEVQNIPDNTVISTEEMMNKVEQITQTTEELSVIVNVNQDNAASIREIVGRFSS